MRAVRYDKFGGIDEIYVDDMVAMPTATPGQVVVQVLASCINAGSLTALEGATYVPLRDVAGVAAAVGQDVDTIAVGDEILGWVQDWAAHAEFVAIPADQLIPKPTGLSWDVAGSLFVTPMAALAATRAVDPRAGEIVVIAGASGAVGSTAVQLCLRAGAKVIGLASAATAATLRAQGVIPIDYAGDVEAGIRTAANDEPLAAFIDTVGRGYVASAAALGVAKERINTVVDYKAAKELGTKCAGTMNAGGAAGLSELASLAASGDLTIPIYATYPLRDVQAAYRAVAGRTACGRVVLHPAE